MTNNLFRIITVTCDVCIKSYHSIVYQIKYIYKQNKKYNVLYSLKDIVTFGFFVKYVIVALMYMIVIYQLKHESDFYFV